MRFLTAILILAVAAPAWAGKKTAACKNHCDSNYQFCMNRAVTKSAKRSCKADRKNCKGNCK